MNLWVLRAGATVVLAAALSACQPRPSFAPHTGPGAAAPATTTADEESTLAEWLASLDAAGVRYRMAPVASATTRAGVTCHIPDGVRILRGSGGMRYQKQPHVSAAFAVRLVAFEQTVQQLAHKWFGQSVKRIDHFGTFVCRKVAGTAGTLSEHAAGNAIDVSGFVLKNGVHVNIKRDYVKAGRVPQKPAEHFLHDLVTRLRAERIFGVILTPDWDAKHHNHLHLDGSRRFSLWRLFS